MQGRLATRELKYLRSTLRRDETVEHRIDLFVRELEARARQVRASIRKTQRAVEIARRIHFDQRKAGVLLVVRAEPAIEGTSVADLGREPERKRARFVVALDPRVQLGVVEH